MPTYQYECDACGHAFEILQSMTAKKLRKCPECGKIKLSRLIGTGGGIIFKGTGFYETDFKTKKESDKTTSKSENTKQVKKEGKAEKSDSKSESKSVTDDS